jgi:integrase
MATEQKRRGRGRAGNGEGSIRLRADGRYEARISMPDGSRRSIFGRSHKDVVGKKVAALNDVRVGLPLPDKRQTLGAFLDNWLEDSVRPKVAASTLKSYSYLVRVHLAPALGRVTLEKLTPQRIQTFLNVRHSIGL